MSKRTIPAGKRKYNLTLFESIGKDIMEYAAGPFDEGHWLHGAPDINPTWYKIGEIFKAAIDSAVLDERARVKSTQGEAGSQP